ncbi:MAG: hypothetical protein IT289_05275 [Oligoflexia bacterium]|nr:hypothetical protein [Oligoflexia bacterium]
MLIMRFILGSLLWCLTSTPLEASNISNLRSFGTELSNFFLGDPRCQHPLKQRTEELKYLACSSYRKSFNAFRGAEDIAKGSPATQPTGSLGVLNLVSASAFYKGLSKIKFQWVESVWVEFPKPTGYSSFVLTDSIKVLRTPKWLASGAAGAALLALSPTSTADNDTLFDHRGLYTEKPELLLAHHVSPNTVCEYIEAGSTGLAWSAIKIRGAILTHQIASLEGIISTLEREPQSLGLKCPAGKKACTEQALALEIRDSLSKELRVYRQEQERFLILAENWVNHWNSCSTFQLDSDWLAAIKGSNSIANDEENGRLAR